MASDSVRDLLTRRGAMGLLAVGTGLLVSGCALISGESTYRFRMTVEVQTPQSLKSGSSVMEIVAYKDPFVIGDYSGGHSGVGGQAVVIDLPGGPVFALLTIGDGAPLLASQVTYALAPEARSGDFDAYLAAVRKLGRASEGAIEAELPHHLSYSYGGDDHPEADLAWPMMVRFRNLNDPMSVERVDPAAIGVKRIILTVTKEPLTVGIDKRLGWLEKLENFRYDGKTPFNELYPREATYLRTR